MKRRFNKNEKGFAILESMVFLTAFVLLAVYAIDFFSAIHTGVLGSISARTYLFETLRHRSNIDFLRINRAGTYAFANDRLGHERFHTVNDEDAPPENSGGALSGLPAVGRILTQAEEIPRGSLKAGSIRFSDQQKTSVLYIKSGYGICTDAYCAKDGG